MSYLTELDQWLDTLLKQLEPGQEIASTKQALGAKILESYHNGQRACPKCHPRPARRAQASQA